MSLHSGLIDPAAVQANRAGQITNSQRDAVKNRLDSLPGWVSLVVLFGLIGLAAVIGGRALTQSTMPGIGALVVVILLTAAISSWLGGIVARGRMGTLMVESAPGTVVWKDNHYVAESGGDTLEPITSKLDLPPGDYTFYVLHGKNWMLSAEPASRPVASVSPSQGLDTLRALVDRGIDFDPQQSPDKATERLMELQQAAEQLQMGNPSAMDQEAMRDLMRQVTGQVAQLTQGQNVRGLMHMAQAVEAAFHQPVDAHGIAELNRALEQARLMNPTALETNRQGQLTGSQRGALLKDLRSNLLWAVIILVGGLFLLYLGSSKLDITGLLAVSGFMALIEIMLLFQVRRDLSDAVSGKALLEQGLVTKYTHTTPSRGRSSTTYYLRVNQVSVKIWRTAYEALLEGNYRVYYAPSTKRFLNIEPVQATTG